MNKSLSKRLADAAAMGPEYAQSVQRYCGRIGGLAKSKAKREAARKNGKLGGRPKGRKISVDTVNAVKQ